MPSLGRAPDPARYLLLRRLQLRGQCPRRRLTLGARRPALLSAAAGGAGPPAGGQAGGGEALGSARSQPRPGRGSAVRAGSVGEPRAQPRGGVRGGRLELCLCSALQLLPRNSLGKLRGAAWGGGRAAAAPTWSTATSASPPFGTWQGRRSGGRIGKEGDPRCPPADARMLVEWAPDSSPG